MFINPENYKKRLEQKGLTVNHLIKITETPRNRYYDYVSGKREVDSKFITKLANELVCPITYITK